jgi:hypothetical protein
MKMHFSQPLASDRLRASIDNSQHFVLGKEKPEGEIVTCQAKKIINHTIVAGFSEFMFYSSTSTNLRN